ncbi:hypothetical protein TNCV_198071 [Trichonephila clavipes]|nr:hypothetical protein TNCV_198071 [Trichonephila clavipes]
MSGFLPVADAKDSEEFFLESWRSLITIQGCGSPVVKISADGRHVRSSSPQRRSLDYNGDSMGTWLTFTDGAKFASFLVTLLATWRLIEQCRMYAVAPPGGELQQRG